MSRSLWLTLWRPLDAAEAPHARMPPSVPDGSPHEAALFVRLHAAWWLLWMNVLPLLLFGLMATKRVAPDDGVGMMVARGALVGWITFVVGLHLAAMTQRIVMIGIYRVAFRRAPASDWWPSPERPARDSSSRQAKRLLRMFLWGLLLLAIFLGWFLWTLRF